MPRSRRQEWNVRGRQVNGRGGEVPSPGCAFSLTAPMRSRLIMKAPRAGCKEERRGSEKFFRKSASPRPNFFAQRGKGSSGWPRAGSLALCGRISSSAILAGVVGGGNWGAARCAGRSIGYGSGVALVNRFARLAPDLPLGMRGVSIQVSTSAGELSLWEYSFTERGCQVVA